MHHGYRVERRSVIFAQRFKPIILLVYMASWWQEYSLAILRLTTWFLFAKTWTLFHVCVKEAITQDAYKDLYRCIHFVDNWEADSDEEWNEFFHDDAKVVIDDATVAHWSKFGIVEDGSNSQWQEVINFGRWLTADESQVSGWYKSQMTCGPEPKPIQTGAALHTLCVIHGPLSTYKVFAPVYGGAKDENLSNNKHRNTTNLQKWVYLYNLMLEPFKGKGRCVTMDSAYEWYYGTDWLIWMEY